jgi:hypothetical protein
VQVVDPNHHITVEQKGSSSERPSEVHMDEPSEITEIRRVDMAIPGKAMSSGYDFWNAPAGQAYDPTHPTKVTVTLEEMAAAANLKPEEMAAVIEQNTLQD